MRFSYKTIPRIYLSIIIVGVVSILVSSLAIYWATYQGIGVSWDGVYYLRGAREIVYEHNYTLTHFPPFTSILIATGYFWDSTLLMPARWIFLILFCISILCLELMVFKLTRSVRLVIFGVIIFATSLSVFPAFVQISSEAPFFAFWLLSFYFFLLFEEKQKNIYFVLSSIFASSTFLARYSGIIVIVTYLIVIFLDIRLSIKGRIYRASEYLFVSIFFPFVYLLRNTVQTEMPTSRILAFHPPSWQELSTLRNNILEWFLPDRIIAALQGEIAWGLILCLLFGVLFLFVYSCRRILLLDNLFYVFNLYYLIFISLYILFLLMARTLLDEDIDFNTRQLAPVFIAFLLILLAQAKPIMINLSNRKYLALIFLLSGYFFLLSIYPFFSMVRSFHSDGIDYTGVVWKGSETLQYVQENLVGRVVITNQPLVLELYSQNLVLEMPNKYVYMNKDRFPNPDFINDVQALRLLFDDQDVVIVYFENKAVVEGYLTPSELSQEIVLCRKFSDGEIYWCCN